MVAGELGAAMVKHPDVVALLGEGEKDVLLRVVSEESLRVIEDAWRDNDGGCVGVCVTLGITSYVRVPEAMQCQHIPIRDNSVVLQIQVILVNFLAQRQFEVLIDEMVAWHAMRVVANPMVRQQPWPDVLLVLKHVLVRAVKVLREPRHFIDLTSGPGDKTDELHNVLGVPDFRIHLGCRRHRCGEQ